MDESRLQFVEFICWELRVIRLRGLSMVILPSVWFASLPLDGLASGITAGFKEFLMLNFVFDLMIGRACGSIVCNSCSPFRTPLPGLNEEGGSRVCKSCFGLKPAAISAMDSPSSPTPPSSFNSAGSDKMSPALASPMFQSGSGSRKKGFSFNGSQAEHSTPQQQSPFGGALASPNNLHSTFSAEKVAHGGATSPMAVPVMSYEACYRRMRQLIPVDVQSRSNKRVMAEQGLPPDIATRVATTKALWLICMHPDDVAMVERFLLPFLHLF